LFLFEIGLQKTSYRPFFIGRPKKQRILLITQSLSGEHSGSSFKSHPKIGQRILDDLTDPISLCCCPSKLLFHVRISPKSMVIIIEKKKPAILFIVLCHTLFQLIRKILCYTLMVLFNRHPEKIVSCSEPFNVVRFFTN